MKPASYFSQTKGLVKDLSSIGLRPQVSYTSRIEVPKKKKILQYVFSANSSVSTQQQLQKAISENSSQSGSLYTSILH